MCFSFLCCRVSGVDLGVSAASMSHPIVLSALIRGTRFMPQTKQQHKPPHTYSIEFVPWIWYRRMSCHFSLLWVIKYWQCICLGYYLIVMVEKLLWCFPRIVNEKGWCIGRVFDKYMKQRKLRGISVNIFVPNEVWENI